VDGQLLSVTDLGAWSGFAAAAGAVLQIRSDIENCGLRVDEIIGTESVTATVSPVDGSDQSVMPGALSLVFDFKNERYRILDVAVLVQSPAFIDILEASPA